MRVHADKILQQIQSFKLLELRARARVQLQHTIIIFLPPPPPTPPPPFLLGPRCHGPNRLRANLLRLPAPEHHLSNPQQLRQQQHNNNNNKHTRHTHKTSLENATRPRRCGQAERTLSDRWTARTKPQHPPLSLQAIGGEGTGDVAEYGPGRSSG